MKNLYDSLFKVLKVRYADEKLADQAAQTMVDIFKATGTGRKHQILITNYTIPDGIGDAKNAIDYFLWTKEIFKDCEQFVAIKMIIFVSEEKIPQVLDRFPKDFDQEKYLYMCPDDLSINASKLEACEVTICKGERFSENEISLSERLEYMEKLVATPQVARIFGYADFVLNIAVPFQRSGNLLLDKIAKTCWIRSRLEYGPVKYPRNELIGNDRIYVEDWMGLRKQDAGIKFNNSLYQGSHQLQTLEQKAEKLMQVNNQKLLAKMLGENIQISNENVRIYLCNKVLAIGYLQKKYTNSRFVRLVAATSEKDVDIFINLKLCDEYLRLHLLQLGFTHFEWINLQTNKHATYAFELIPKNRSIRFFDFSDLDDLDKDCISMVANYMAGSGDNSYSDVQAAQGFPFFEVLFHKKDFFKTVIDFIKEHNIDNQDKLISYLEWILKMTPNISTDEEVCEKELAKFYNFVKDNRQEIFTAWQQVSHRVYATKNAKSAFYELIYGFIISRFFECEKRPAAINKFVDLFFENSNGNDKVANESIFHLALLKHNGAGIECLKERCDLQSQAGPGIKATLMELVQMYGHSLGTEASNESSYSMR